MEIAKNKNIVNEQEELDGHVNCNQVKENTDFMGEHLMNSPPGH